METVNPFQESADRVASALDDYMETVLKCQNVERKINYLINFGSLCYDYNQPIYASKAYKLALDICLANETGIVPRFKDYAYTAARSIQYLADTCQNDDCRAMHVHQIEQFYKDKFPGHN